MESEYLYEKFENDTAICGYLGKYADLTRNSENKKITAVSNLYYKCKADTVTAKSIGISAKRTAYPYMERLVVGNPLNIIKCYAFCGSRNLEYAEITGDCIIVEEGIFMDCTKLRTAILGSWSENIPPYTFKGCCLLDKLSFAALPKRIGASAFEKCVNLRSIDLSCAVFTGRRAFFGCMSLEKVTFKSLDELCSLAFAECSSLTEFEMDKCENIGSDIFKGCFALSKVKISAEKVNIEKLLESVNKEITLSLEYSHGIAEISLPLQFGEYKKCLNKCSFDFFKYDEISIKNKNIKAAYERTESGEHLSTLHREEYINVLRDNIILAAEYALKNNKIKLLLASGAADPLNISKIRHILGKTAEYRAYLIESSEEGSGKKYEL